MEHKTTHQCFVCNQNTVIGDNNFKGPESGVIQTYHCTNCGAEYELTTPEETEE